METEIDLLENPFILLALSIIPGLIYVSIYYNMDKHRKEPLAVILKSFFWGAAAVLPIGIFQSFIPEEGFAGFLPFYAVYMILIVGFTEELGKWLVTRFYSFRDSAFDEVTDGIVYGVCVGGGFAVFENIFYVFDHGFETGILRSVLSVPGHIFWGAISGYWLAMYKFGGVSRSTMLMKGLGVASISHGLFNTFLNYDYTIIISPMIVIANGLMVRKYFRLALEHDEKHIHSVQKTTVSREFVEELPDGSVAYKKKKYTKSIANPGLVKLVGTASQLVGIVFIITMGLALFGFYLEAENIQDMAKDWDGLIAVFVIASIGFLLIFKGNSLKKKLKIQDEEDYSESEPSIDSFDNEANSIRSDIHSIGNDDVVIRTYYDKENPPYKR
ncbi:MAG: PrsW family intramembrane metalloprotease [Leptospira sp.]|nr:PrsW family intramembrane metalloprotease [Leptospira sp.]